MENTQQFEQRKTDHIRIALSEEVQATEKCDFDRIELVHEAVPELNLESISLKTKSFGHNFSSPLFVSSMTAGHQKGFDINLRLAQACSQKNWLMGVGSQRRQLTDPSAREEWETLRAQVPNVKLMGNIGLTQLIETPIDKVEELVQSLDAVAMIVHSNPLQEALQPEGTPQFANGLSALDELCSHLSVPVIFKETGCGFSTSTLERLKPLSLHALDVSGNGGTHWGRIEGLRSSQDSIQFKAAQTFKNWGVSTTQSLLNAQSAHLPFAVWGSGGVRSGLHAAKCIALGAELVGFAKPIIDQAMESTNHIVKLMDQLEFELKVALFCTGSKTLADLKNKYMVQEL